MPRILYFRQRVTDYGVKTLPLEPNTSNPTCGAAVFQLTFLFAQR